MYKRLILLLLLFTLGLSALVQAQDIIPNDTTEFDPDAVITWPPPVYVLRGDVDILGTANLDDMTNYFIEFRPLDVADFDPEAAPEPAATDEPDDEAEDDDMPWFPVVLPSGNPVVDDVLGTWDTETTDDGLYEIRLVVNRDDLDPVYFVVSPLRIENEAPDFVPVVEATATSRPSTRPTLAASPTPLDTTPRITANTDANVREGDSTIYPVVGGLDAGDTVRVLGISSTGSGWYYIELADGNRGFVASSLVSASGDIRSVPRVNPPPPPFTPTPLPTNTPVPNGNLAASSPSIDPLPPVCQQPFDVLVNIINNGSTSTTAEAIVLIQDIHVATGAVQASISRTLPVLEPGRNYVVGGPMTVSTYFSEEHRIVVTIDVNGTVAETNENDNVVTASYTLARGGC